jgi:hypothetical protein
MRAALLALWIVTGCGATAPSCPAYVASPIARPFVWRVSGPHGWLVIQATHQGAGPDDVSPAAWAALDQAHLYIAEADEAVGHQQGDPDQPNPLFHLPPDRSLRRVLPGREFDALREYIGIRPHELARLRPWVAFILLGRSQVRFAEPSMNQGLLERARARHLALLFLETWTEQASYLDAAITPGKLSRAIRDAPNLSCRLARRLDAFRAGDDRVFSNEVVAGEPVIPRIERWYVRLRRVVDSGQPAFAALGVGQVLGPYGLLTRFATAGYQVQRL